jgi:hypothetical protein
MAIKLTSRSPTHDRRTSKGQQSQEVVAAFYDSCEMDCRHAYVVFSAVKGRSYSLTPSRLEQATRDQFSSVALTLAPRSGLPKEGLASLKSQNSRETLARSSIGGGGSEGVGQGGLAAWGILSSLALQKGG